MRIGGGSDLWLTRLKPGGWMVIIGSILNLFGLGILAFLPILIGIMGGVLILVGK